MKRMNAIPILITRSSVRLVSRVVVTSGVGTVGSQVAVFVDVKAMTRRLTAWKPGQTDRYRYVTGRRLTQYIMHHRHHLIARHRK